MGPGKVYSAFADRPALCPVLQRCSSDLTVVPVYLVPACVHYLDPHPCQGAGDAFVGAMAYYLACHPRLPFEEVIRRSSIIAGYTVTAPGTQTSYCTDKLPKELLQS